MPRKQTTALAMLVAGLALTLVAGGLTHTLLTRDAVAQAEGPAPIVVHGPGDVAVVTVVYEPGQGSQWHAHEGLHAVAVIAGELTVYGPDCRAETFGPGRPYIGGQELHMERNETAHPVELIVTHLKAGRSNPTPPRCLV
ncbi:MAG: cupin domain-containing protein [Acidimicrobiales bacterium]